MTRFLMLAAAALCLAAGAGGNPNREEFRRSRFGLFVHWGLYAQAGGRWKGQSMDYIGEWLQARFRIPGAEYAALAGDFNPTRFDAEAWVRTAKEAGMSYVVLTAKHHEGFAMFKSEASDFNVVDATPFKRDVFAELAAACRRHGVKVCFYYSQCLDWHEFDAADVVESRGGNFGMDWGNSWDWPDASKKDIGRYLKGKVYPQLKELLTNYGDVFYVWFDCPFGMTREQTRELREYVRSLSPDTLVNSRIGYGLCDVGSMGDNREFAGRVSGLREAPVTLNDTWGFKWDDRNWKSAYDVACILAKTIACDANLLLNVGPRPDGAFPEESSRVLAELASWRKATGFEIYGAKANPFPCDFPWGWCTVAADGTLQFVVRREWRGDLEVAGVLSPVKACNFPCTQRDGVLSVALPAPEPSATMPRVVRVGFDGDPEIDQALQPQNGELLLLPHQGEIIAGVTGGDDGAVIGAAGERYGTAKCRLAENGALEAWHHAGDGMAWKVRMPRTATWRVLLRTESVAHSAEWADDREVELDVDGVKFVKKLAKDVGLPHTVYDRAESFLAELKLSAGEHMVKVVTVRSGRSAAWHNLLSLRMKSVSALLDAKAVFEGDGRGKVAFVGGSITELPGYRPMVMAYLTNRFPKTEFDFLGAGRSS